MEIRFPQREICTISPATKALVFHGSVQTVRSSASLTTIAILALTACTTPTQNFRDQTEEYLNDSSAVSAQFNDVDVTDANCERPDDTAIGTDYRCTATVPGEGTVTFRVRITANDEFSIVGFSG